jgi:hypothetical protein
VSKTPQRLYGWVLWPILNDDTGDVEYWDIHRPCFEHDPRHACPCAADASQGDYTAATLAEARDIVRKHTPYKMRGTLAEWKLHRIGAEL